MKKTLQGFCLLTFCFLGMGSIGASEPTPICGDHSQHYDCNCRPDRCRHHQDRPGCPDMYPGHDCDDHQGPCDEHSQCHCDRDMPNFIGSAYGPSKIEQDVIIPANYIGQGDAPVNAPLFHADVQCGAPFKFMPYNKLTGLGGYFTVQASGKYLLQYGLTAVPSNALVDDILAAVLDYQNTSPTAALWIGIRVVRGCEQYFYGAVPLSLALTMNLDPSVATSSQSKGFSAGSAKSNYLVSGFGQIALKLRACDQVYLQIYVGINQNIFAPYLAAPKGISEMLYIGSENITWPLLPQPAMPGLSRGPTLTIQKICAKAPYMHCCE